MVAGTSFLDAPFGVSRRGLVALPLAQVHDGPVVYVASLRVVLVRPLVP